MKNRFNDIKATLMVYPIRKVQIDDFRLRLEELKARDTLKAQGYEEAVQISKRCNNNDSYLYDEEKLEKLIQAYTISNKRVENMVKCIKKDLIREVVIKVMLDSKSINEVCKDIDRSERQVNNLLKEGLKIIAENITP
ncbi:MAG: hypothetical protein RR620_12885 [Clostridium sp.]